MPNPEEPDPLAALLLLSVAEREQAAAALLESLAADPQGASALKRARSALDRLMRKDSKGGSSGWRGQGLSRR